MKEKYIIDLTKNLDADSVKKAEQINECIRVKLAPIIVILLMIGIFQAYPVGCESPVNYTKASVLDDIYNGVTGGLGALGDIYDFVITIPITIWDFLTALLEAAFFPIYAAGDVLIYWITQNIPSIYFAPFQLIYQLGALVLDLVTAVIGSLFYSAWVDIIGLQITLIVALRVYRLIPTNG